MPDGMGPHLLGDLSECSQSCSQAPERPWTMTCSGGTGVQARLTPANEPGHQRTNRTDFARQRSVGPDGDRTPYAGTNDHHHDTRKTPLGDVRSMSNMCKSDTAHSRGLGARFKSSRLGMGEGLRAVAPTSARWRRTVTDDRWRYPFMIRPHRRVGTGMDGRPVPSQFSSRSSPFGDVRHGADGARVPRGDTHERPRTAHHRLGKRVGGNPSRVRISHPPQLILVAGQVLALAGSAVRFWVTIQRSWLASCGSRLLRSRSTRR